MNTVLKKMDNGVTLHKVQGLLFKEPGRCYSRVLMATQLVLIEEFLSAGNESLACVGALEAVAAFRGELSRSLLRKDVLQRLIKVMQLVPGVVPGVTELRQMVANSY